MDQDMEDALAMLCEQLQGFELTAADLRRETIWFVCTHCPDVSRAEVEAIYDQMIFGGKVH